MQVTMPDAQVRLPELLAVAATGEVVRINTEEGHSFCLTVDSPVQPDKAGSPVWPGYPAAGSCKGMIWMADNFDEPLEELREYTE